MIAEYRALKELRRARRMSQAAVAAKLKIDQAGVSKLEKRGDLLISTLRAYVEAAGGTLELTAHFPDAPPIRIQSLGSAGAPKADELG